MNKKAFTLAEVLIVLTLLGIVAMLTLPTVIQRSKEAAERTKIRHGMENYDAAILNMTVENGIKSKKALETFGEEGGNCKNTTTYFKKSEGAGCRFKTSDGLWWDISDITNCIKTIDFKNSIRF